MPELVRALMGDAPEITRQFEPDLEVRADGTGRTIAGIIVPFERVARVSDGGPAYNEAFRLRAFARTIEHSARTNRMAKLLSHHLAGRNPLGRASLLREDTVGVYGEFKVARTHAGDEALELAKDGALDAFSVGFGPVRHIMEKGVVVRTEVKLREVSLVTFPAYDDARITSVRSTIDALAEMTSEQRAELIAALSRELGSDTPVGDSSSLDTATALVLQVDSASATPQAPQITPDERIARMFRLVSGITAGKGDSSK